jgi:5'-nucleotidase
MSKRLVAALILFFASISATAGTQSIKVRIAAFNDFHGHLKSPGKLGPHAVGGVDALAGYIDGLRKNNANTIVVSAGDLIGASPLISGLFHDEPTIEAMNRLGLDINAVGNHEFDEGASELLRMQQGGCHPSGLNTCKGKEVGTSDPFEGAKFAFLAANVVHRPSGATLFPPYVIKRFEGVPVAFIGLTLRGTNRIVRAKGVAGLSFLGEAKSVNELIPELRRQGVEAIVVLLHEGGRQSGTFDECEGISGPIVAIVDRLDAAVDLVISGHTHQSYNCRLPNRAGDRIPVTSAGSYGRFLSDIELQLDPRTHDVSRVEARNIEVRRDDIAPNAELARLVEAYDRLAAPLAERVVGRITGDFTRDTDDVGESALGRLVADAQLHATRASNNADIAFMNMGGLRADLPFKQRKHEGDGRVTYEEIYAVHPFGNALVTLTLTGAQIKTLLEQQFGCPRDRARPRLLQVSEGFEYTWNPSAKSCAKVAGNSIRLNGVVVQPDKRYRVTVNDYLAEGGDGLRVLKEGAEQQGGVLDRDALASYLQAHSSLSPSQTPRIRLAR